jgi:hypothetical protein
MMSQNPNDPGTMDDDNQLGEEPGMLERSEELDQDDLGAEPVTRGVDPPDHWAAADDFGTTQREEREGESLEGRLARERPDVSPDPRPASPGADRDVTDFDERDDDGLAQDARARDAAGETEAQPFSRERSG